MSLLPARRDRIRSIHQFEDFCDFPRDAIAKGSDRIKMEWLRLFYMLMKYLISLYLSLAIFSVASLSIFFDPWLHPSPKIRWMRWIIAVIFWLGTIISNILFTYYKFRLEKENLKEELRTLQKLEALQSTQICRTCTYYLQSYKTGEPNICNALHPIEIEQTECSDWQTRGTIQKREPSP